MALLQVEALTMEPLVKRIWDAADKRFDKMRDPVAVSLLSEAAEEIERLTKDLESGFMEGAYARLKNLQAAEEEVDHLRDVEGALREVHREDQEEITRLNG